ncbi:MAG: hypothetical protein R6X19_11110 [Kiritimatiellia bacterium]
MLVGVMEYEQMLEWPIDEPERIKLLADTWLERTWARVDFELESALKYGKLGALQNCWCFIKGAMTCGMVECLVVGWVGAAFRP